MTCSALKLKMYHMYDSVLMYIDLIKNWFILS